MELANFLKLLKKFRLALILIPLITVVVTFLLARRIPKVYISQSQIATGIVDESQNLINQISQESQINQKFSNIIATMQMRKILSQVSYKLMLHDLTNANPYRPASRLLRNLNPSARQHAIEVYNLMCDEHKMLDLENHDQYGLNSVISSMGYDAGSIGAKLSVFRSENSDFITVQFESENPELSAFVVNTLIKEFTSYYVSQIKDNQSRALSFLDTLLQAKKAAMDTSVLKLKNYKIKNHILNLNEQARSLYTQLADIETRKEQAVKDVAAYTGSINNINKQFNPNDKRYIESTLTQINSNILSTKEQLKQTTDQWIRSNYDATYKSRIDSLQSILTRQINESIDKSTNTPLASKTNLITQKLNLGVQLDLAKYSINSYDNEIQRLRQQLDVLVPNEAVIQTLENEVDVKTREYLEVLQKNNQTTMQSSFSSKMQQIDTAEPEGAQPSKTMLLVVASGVLSFTICLLVLFILFYIDNAIKQPKALANQTGLPVLGVLNGISPQVLDLKQLWNNDNINNEVDFKDQLRSTRFEIDQELKNNKILAITSLDSGEGKTVVALSLAHAYNVIGKKVLIIDGNFESRSISQNLPHKATIEDYFKYGILNAEQGITVMGNKGGNLTLLEIQHERTINERLNELRSMYDVIIIEIPALEKLNKAKEWLLFTDKAIAVFEAGKSLSENKKQLVAYLKSLKDKFSGWVFNKMNPEDAI